MKSVLSGGKWQNARHKNTACKDSNSLQAVNTALPITQNNLEGHSQLHLESLFAVYSMRDILGHDQGLALFHVEYFAAYGESALAFQNGHHSITACCVGRDFLALVKGKNRHAHIVVLYQRLADYLSLLVFHQILQI